MKFLIIGDLHGSMPKIHFKDFDAVIAPGDFCSDKRKDLVWRAIKQKENEGDENNKSKEVMWYDLCGRKEAKKMIDESVASGRKILKYLNSLGKPVFIVSGNWDYTGVPKNLLPKKTRKKIWSYWIKNHYNEMINGLENIIDLSFKAVDFNGVILIGYGVFHIGSGTAPEDKNDFMYAYSRLYSLFMQSKLFNFPIIFLSHNVPYNTKIDKVLNKKSPAYGKHYGSVVVKEIIKDFQPLVNIGGHIHEHFGKTRIKKTVCINTGFGPNVNTLLDIDLSDNKNKIKKIEFYP